MADQRQWYFYIIALAPDLHPHRLKFGISIAPESRFAQHATAAPTAKLLKVFDIPNPARIYEQHCIRVGRGTEYARVGAEVYDVDDAVRACERVQEYLGEMYLGPDDSEFRRTFTTEVANALHFARSLRSMRNGADAEMVALARDRLLNILLHEWANPDCGPL